MTMQTDVLSSAVLSSTGPFLDQSSANIGKTRIKGIFTLNGASAGSVSIADGQGGAAIVTVPTPAAANLGSTYVLLPGEGLRVKHGPPYATVANTTSVVIFYG